jgi:hypothetical protein
MNFPTSGALGQICVNDTADRLFCVIWRILVVRRLSIEDKADSCRAENSRPRLRPWLWNILCVNSASFRLLRQIPSS